MYDTILFPTDGSEPAQDAIDAAIDLASRYDATLHALYVVDVAAFDVPDADTSFILAAFEEEGATAVEAVREAASAADVPCETAVVTGTPADSILSYVDDHDVDCLVMATHGRRGLSRLLLGSTTERVVRRSSVPVLVVPAAEE
ncbi:universal stress protein [Halorarius litoreus]|uniref:universal stress protein n=1 Tax=Halorarius litoreus TaxID=2962676 RepID=UPI0020CD0022|nr:universal stress protein [Halorarius litoreus]